MKPEQIKAFFQSVYSADKVMYSPEMLDEFYARVAPEMVFHRAPFPDVSGREANRQSDEATAVAYTDNKIQIHDLVVEGDTAVLRYTWEADHTGVSPSLGIPPTGKHVQAVGCMVTHWKDDKMVEIWDYLDILGLLQQVGMIPAMG